MNRRRTIIVLIVLIAAFGLFYWNLQETTSPMKISNPKAVLKQEAGIPFPVYLTLENTGEADRLIAVTSPLSESVMVMGANGEGGTVIPAGSKPGFASDGAHIMVMDADADLQDGSFVPLVLTFQNAGEVSVKALVSRPATAAATDTSGNDAGESGMAGHAMHGQGAIHEVAAGDAVPEISLAVQADPETGGYRVTVETDNFEFFKPDGDMAPHAAGQGHGHLYLDGLKLQRMYGPEAVIGALLPGTYTVAGDTEYERSPRLCRKWEDCQRKNHNPGPVTGLFHVNPVSSSRLPRGREPASL